MKGKVSVLIDGRLRFSKKYKTINERKDIIGQWKLQHPDYDMVLTIEPYIDRFALPEILKEPIRDAYAKGGITQQQLADQYHVSPYVIYRLLKGKVA